MLASRMARVFAMMMYRGGFLKVPFESFSKGPRGFSYVFIIAGKVTTLEPVYGPNFVAHGVFVLGKTSRFLMVLLPLKWVCILTSHRFFNAFTETLCAGYYYMTLVFNFIDNRLGTCSALAVSPIIDHTR